MKKYLISGLLLLLPLLLTILIVHFIFDVLTNPFTAMTLDILKTLPWTHNWNFTSESILLLTRVLILVFLFFFTTMLGFLARSILFKTFFNSIDSILMRFPFIRGIHKTVKQVTRSLFAPEKEGIFEKATLLHFPSYATATVGLISSGTADIAFAKEGEHLISIFIPVSPQVVPGFLLMVSENNLKNPGMSAEEAVKYIVSCGSVFPQNAKS